AERVPDRRPPAVLGHGPLDLVGGRRRAPQEPVRELQGTSLAAHPFAAFPRHAGARAGIASRRRPCHILNRLSTSCRWTTLTRVIFVREGAAADIPAVEEVRRASWRAAYAGLIEARHIERATARPSRLSQPDPARRT